MGSRGLYPRQSRPRRYRQYKINTYTVTFVDYDGKVLNEQTVDWDGAAIYPSDPSREGYHFTGWDQAIDHVKADRTVTAQYAINTYTVTFVDYDGVTVLKEQTVDWDTDATAPEDPKRDGFIFTGWDKDFTHVKADLTVKAQYKEDPGTGFDSIQDSAISIQKVLRDGSLYIIIGDKTYDATGRLVQ